MTTTTTITTLTKPSRSAFGSVAKCVNRFEYVQKKNTNEIELRHITHKYYTHGQLRWFQHESSNSQSNSLIHLHILCTMLCAVLYHVVVEFQRACVTWMWFEHWNASNWKILPIRRLIFCVSVNGTMTKWYVRPLNCVRQKADRQPVLNQFSFARAHTRTHKLRRTNANWSHKLWRIWFLHWSNMTVLYFIITI